MKILSDDDRERFAKDGYLVFRGFLSQSELQGIDAEITQLIDSRLNQVPSEHVFSETFGEKATLKQIQHLDRYLETISCLFHRGSLKHLADEILGETSVGMNVQYFNKPPAGNQPTPAHQHAYYFKLTPPHALTMWLALDKVNQNNGCVRYLPGSQLKGLREHARTTTLGFSQGIQNYPSTHEADSEVPITADPGDLLVHHALTIHRAESNQSKTLNRRAVGFIYYAESATEDQIAKNNYERMLENDLRASGRI